MKKAPNVVDLFCGIGGASLGFKLAGYDIRLGLDIDSKACEIYKKNIDTKVIVNDINNYSPNECLSDANLLKGEVDVLICCPPCQGFSRIRKNGEKDSRNDLVDITAEFVLALKPKILLFENVPGILTEKYKGKLNHFLSLIRKNNYLFFDDLRREYLLNASDYGIPQSRKRFVLFAMNGSYKDKEISFLKKTHSEANNELLKWKTVRDAIGDLSKLKSGKKSKTDIYHKAPTHTKRIVKLISKIKRNGGSRKDLPEKFVLECHKNFSGYQDVYGRLVWDKPAPTLTSGWHTPSKGRYIHPKQNRGLTIREACRLQTFPDNFDFCNASKIQIASFIGNAVPVEWMRVVALHIAKEMKWENRLYKTHQN